MMKSKSKFMIKYVIFLLTFALIGCHTEPQFANPIEPTENKTETIQKWMGEFEKPSAYDEAPSTVCSPNPSDYPENTVGIGAFFDNENHIITKEIINLSKHKLFIVENYRGYKHWYIGEDLKEQCKNSYLRLKNKYESILSDPSKKMISEQDYQELNNIYLEERKNVIDKINKIVKRCAETELKNKELNDYQNKNGLPITKDIYGSC